MCKFVYKTTCPRLNQSGTQCAFPQFHNIGQVRSCSHDISAKHQRLSRRILKKTASYVNDLAVLGRNSAEIVEIIRIRVEVQHMKRVTKNK